MRNLLDRSVFEFFEKTSLKDFMLLELFATSIHDLEIVVQICIGRKFCPKNPHLIEQVFAIVVGEDSLI